MPRKVIMCDFCSYIGTEEDVIEHEKSCELNPNRTVSPTPTVRCCKNCRFSDRAIYAGDNCPWTKDNWPLDCVQLDAKATKDYASISVSRKPVSDNHVCDKWEQKNSYYLDTPSTFDALSLGDSDDPRR